MARDLVMDVDRHLRSDNDHLRKKAALAAIRVFTKVPDLVEDFTESILGLLRSKHHGVLLAGVQLITEVVMLDAENLKRFSSLVPKLVRQLRNLLSMGYSSEYDVSGIADPFLQVAILKLLRLLGKDNEEASEAMNDVLAQVATNTETAKTAGNAILYECVQTIMTIESDSGLRVLAINILGRFLLNRDNNIRYVALNTLSKVVTDDLAAVQRHTNTIVDCLKDPDTSIRQRALELIYALVNSSNIQSCVNLNVLVPVANVDAVDRYAPSSRWHIDTLITMLSIAGSTLPDERICSSLITLIQRNTDLHAYVVHKLFWALHDDVSQLSLVHVGIWCVGEYSKLLLLDAPASEDTLNDKSRVNESSVVELFKTILRHHGSTDITRAYSLNAMVKLTTRFSSPSEIAKLNAMISSFNTSMLLELQQRATEYTTLGQPQWSSLRNDVLAGMPAIDASKVRSRNDHLASSAMGSADLLGDEDAAASSSSGTAAAPKPVQAAQSSASASLLDLDDIFGGGASTSSASTSFSASSSAPAPPAVDLLADIFSSGPAAPAPAPATGSFGSSNGGTAAGANDLLGLMDFGAPAPAPPAANPPLRAYEKNGLTVDLEITKPNPDDKSVTYITATMRNSTAMSIEKFVFLAAFPKYIKLKMEPPTGDVVPPNNSGTVTQVVKIQNSMQGEVRLFWL
ncbi:unnamed protein product [Phytophthora lilii]|uniref:AP-1 complex subunit gamma n=1 Tax=Phytophthora lilii TaxID=2077276 RepID=A0A9W6U628_9STRA|nr:unnamed protein product [Phytophthora lilii]